MSKLTLRPMQPEDETFVATCSHVNESDEADAAAVGRLDLLREQVDRGAVVEVALLDGDPVGFAHAVPIEMSSWGPLGERLFVIPCLYVLRAAGGSGIGQRLIAMLEEHARRRANGLVVTGYDNGGDAAWFMPAGYFERLGFKVVERRPPEILFWKPFTSAAEPPRLFRPQYPYQASPGRVVVDLFWNAFCPTSAIEAQRVREVCDEFGGNVRLVERCAEDLASLRCHQLARAIYVNGHPIGWGYEAPRDGIRAAILEAMEAG